MTKSKATKYATKHNDDLRNPGQELIVGSRRPRSRSSEVSECRSVPIASLHSINTHQIAPSNAANPINVVTQQRACLVTKLVHVAARSGMSYACITHDDPVL